MLIVDIGGDGGANVGNACQDSGRGSGSVWDVFFEFPKTTGAKV